MMNISDNKKIFLAALVVIIIFLSGSVSFLVYKKYYSPAREFAKSENTVPVAYARENFDNILRGTSLTGRFGGYDAKKMTVQVLSFDNTTMKVISRSFAVNENTLYYKKFPEFIESNLFSLADFKNIPVGTEIVIFFSPEKNKDGLALISLVQVPESLIVGQNSSSSEK